MNRSLGVQPLLIFFQELLDGDYISLLLSNHLAVATSSNQADRPISKDDNYFTNPAIRKCIDQSKQSNSTNDLSAQLAILMDEGFDTQKLYGLLIPINAFNRINFDKYFINSSKLFLYNEYQQYDEKEKVVLQPVIDYLSTHDEHTMVLNAKFLSTYPLQVLELISQFMDSIVVRPALVLPHTMLATDANKKAGDTLLSKEQITLFKNLDCFAIKFPWCNGEIITLIFHSIFDEEADYFYQRLLEINACFLYTPIIHIVLNDANHFTNEGKPVLLNGNFPNKISFSHQHNNLPAELNRLIATKGKDYILLDDLKANFRLADLLWQVNEQKKETLSFTSISSQDTPWRVSLDDVLIKIYAEHNLLFTRQAWTELHGFDEQMAEVNFCWDYVIRSLTSYRNTATIWPSTYYHPIERKDASSTEAVAQQSMTKVLFKNREIVAKSLGTLIQLAAKENILSQIENKRLHEKMASLQNKSFHAKAELSSLQQLTSQLHRRIKLLENNWYQKVSSKLNRIKRIFFKEKAPGKNSLKRIFAFIKFIFSKAGFGIVRKVMANLFKRLFLLFEKRSVEIVYKDQGDRLGIYTYNDWIKKKLAKDVLNDYYSLNKASLKSEVLISIIMPVYNTPLKFLKEAIESVLAQQYEHWELCIVDDCSKERKIQKMLHVYSLKDQRIRIQLRTENGHISAASNDALAMASGEFVLLMDHDDLISANCLFELVKTINEHPEVDILYSDEDKIDEKGFHQNAHFKPIWAPDHFLSRNYLGHVVALKRTLMNQIGGFRLGFEGSQDYDLLLRATELSQQIVHIPKVLYHWRIHQDSAAQGEDVKPYAYIAAKRALEDAIQRRGLQGSVKYLSGLRGYRIDYELQSQDLVSIIVPTKDQTTLLKNTIDSIIEKTSYKNYEIIVLNNNSISKEFYNWCDEYKLKYASLLSIHDAHFPFNFSKLMNLGRSLAKGQHLLLLNNDVEIIKSDWLSIMLAYSQQERIGAVGVKLLYPDDSIQHAGVIVGLGGIAGHAFVGAYREEPGYFNYIQSVNNFSAVTAACLMCKKTLFDKVGGMDETFEVEYNDVDFCLRIMQAGHNNVYLPQVELYHYESATRGHPHQSKLSYERHLKEMKLFKKRWQAMIDADPYYNPNLNLGVHDFGLNFSA